MPRLTDTTSKRGKALAEKIWENVERWPDNSEYVIPAKKWLSYLALQVNGEKWVKPLGDSITGLMFTFLLMRERPSA